MPSGSRSKSSARVNSNASQRPTPGHATRSAATASGQRNSRPMASAGAAISSAAARGSRLTRAGLAQPAQAAGAASTTAAPIPQIVGSAPVATTPVATRASRAAQQSTSPAAAQGSQTSGQASVAQVTANSAPPANLPAAGAYVAEQYVRGSRSARGRSPPPQEPQSPPADASCDFIEPPPRRSPRRHEKHRSDRASSSYKRRRNYSPSSDSNSSSDASESSSSSSSDDLLCASSRKRSRKHSKGHKRRRSRSSSRSSSPDSRRKHHRGHQTQSRRTGPSESAHVPGTLTSGDTPTPSRPQQHEPRAEKPKKHYIPRISKYLRRYPQHFEAMALFRDWPNSQKAEELKDFSKSSGKQTEAVEDLEAALYEGSRGQPAFAFDVVLNYLSAHESRVQIHGGRLALGARYAGQNFTPARGHRSTLRVIGKEILKAWNAVLPHMLTPDVEIPGSVMSGLLDAVRSYFEERADFARGDFGRHKVLKCIARKTRDQSDQVCELLKSYESYFAKGLRKSLMSRTAVNSGWFHLLYEFCRDFGEVPEATFRAPKPPVAARLPQPGVHYQQHHPLHQPQYPQQYQLYQVHQPPAAPQPQQTMSALPPLPPPPPPPPPQQQQRPLTTLGFIGKPMTAAVVGPGLATLQPPVRGCRRCSGGHYAFECPQAYFLRFNEPCPGFDARGNLDQNAWAGGEITGQTKAAWRGYLARHRIPAANQGPAAGRPAVDFS